jgi:hypothetical protein
MKELIAESYLLLFWTGFVIKFRSLQALHRQVQKMEVGNPSSNQLHSTDNICHSMDLACVFYPKQVLCLQRSAATTILLRRHGLRAEMVIGAQMLPFKSHAWVEVGGIVVNDKPYIREIYQVLERC